jgi:hypothetical protein
MFKINQPAMALNSDDVPGATYKMWNTWQVPASSTPDHTLGWTATVARSAPGGYQITLVINCHGFYDKGSDGKLVGGFGLALGTGIRMARHAEVLDPRAVRLLHRDHGLRRRAHHGRNFVDGLIHGYD